MGKLQTPEWIKEGYGSKEAYEKAKGSSKSGKSKEQGKTFKIRKCPKCGSNKVNVVLTGEEGKGAREWECKKCKWKGKNVEEKELSEEQFMKYLDENGEEVS
jgi:formate dehydrogenase maturation protein FdhE